MTPRDLIAAFEVLAEAPDGVKRLRELVLGLAVRGKLVGQVAGDEPAQALLTRSLAKLAQRKPSKRSKMDRNNLPLSQDECPFDLPTGWGWARLAALTEIASGVTLGRDLTGQATRSLPYLRVANVKAGYFDLDMMKQVDVPPDEVEDYRVLPGDVLLTEGGDWDKLGRSAVWSGQIDPCLHQNHVFRARVLEPGLQPRWVSLYTNSPDGRTYFQKCSKQTTNLASINKTQLSLCPIPLPPAPEQVRILSRVDELMSLLDRLEAARETREAQRRAARDSALAALRDAEDAEAVEAAWQRIAGQMETLFAGPEDVGALRQAILGLAVRGRLFRVDTDRHSVSGPFAIPTSWAWRSLESITKAITSGSRNWNQYYSPTGASFIRSQDIKLDRLEYDERAYVQVPDGAEGTRTRIAQGDWLITITGANVGKCALVEAHPGEAYVSQHVALMRPVDRRLGRFGHIWLISDHGGRGLLLEGSYGSKPGLNLTQLRTLPVPVPPADERDRIVAKVDALMALCDQLEARLKTARDLQSSFAASAAHHLDL